MDVFSDAAKKWRSTIAAAIVTGSGDDLKKDAKDIQDKVAIETKNFKQKLEEARKKIFKLHDKDKSGNLDKEEFRGLMKELWLAEKAMVPDLIERSIHLVMSTMAIGDDETNKSKVTKQIQERVQEQIKELDKLIDNADAEADTVFKQLDTDNDGKISKAEFEALTFPSGRVQTALGQGGCSIM